MDNNNYLEKSLINLFTSDIINKVNKSYNCNNNIITSYFKLFDNKLYFIYNDEQSNEYIHEHSNEYIHEHSNEYIHENSNEYIHEHSNEQIHYKIYLDTKIHEYMHFIQNYIKNIYPEYGNKWYISYKKCNIDIIYKVNNLCNIL